MDQRNFFSRPSETVAIDLIGRTLERKWGRGYIEGVVKETGAYEGGNETPSRIGMKYSPGTLFLMPYRGSLFFNIATDREEYPSCVEIREVRFKNKIVTGPGAITKFLSLSDLDGSVLGDKLRIAREPVNPLLVKRTEGSSDNCLGYFSIK